MIDDQSRWDWRKGSKDVLESVATTTELSAWMYLEDVAFNTLTSRPINEHSRSIDITLDEQGDIVLHNVVHAIALPLDAEDAHLVFTVARACECDVGGGGGHDGLRSGSNEAGSSTGV